MVGCPLLEPRDKIYAQALLEEVQALRRLHSFTNLDTSRNWGAGVQVPEPGSFP